MNFYDKEYFDKIKKQKNINLAIFISLIAILVLIDTAIIIFNGFLPYKAPLIKVLKIVMIIFTVIFIFIISIFASIKFSVVNKYYKFLLVALTSKKTITTITVIKFDREISTKENINARTLYCLEWSDSEDDYVERKIYVDAEFDNLEFEQGKILNVKISSNFLLEYEELENEA